jgi:hypothetical protein
MTYCNEGPTVSDRQFVLFGVLAAAIAFWSLIALIVGLVLGWPTVAIGCLAGGVAAGTATSAVIFRVIYRRRRC